MTSKNSYQINKDNNLIEHTVMINFLTHSFIIHRFLQILFDCTYKAV